MKKVVSVLLFLITFDSPARAQVDFPVIKQQAESAVSTVPRDKDAAARQLQQGQIQIPGLTPPNLANQQSLGNFYLENPDQLTTQRDLNATEPGQFLQQSYNIRPRSMLDSTNPLLSTGSQSDSGTFTLMCLDPSSCFDTASAKDPNMPLAASHMNALKSVQDDHTSDPLIIFKGNFEGCRKTVGSNVTRNCCAVDTALLSCSGSEQLLQDHRNAGECVEIGTYCSNRKNLGFTSVCVERTTSFCCFSSKLTRIIQQQGRPQLGIAWGSSESPDCRGFTPEELQRIDFSRIDFSEYYGDITVKPVDTNLLTNQIQNSPLLQQKRPQVNMPIGIDSLRFQEDLGSTVQSHGP